MLTFLASVVIIALALLGMAAGVLLGRRPLAGSCGGLSRSGLSCLLCSKPCARRAHDTASTDEHAGPAR